VLREKLVENDGILQIATTKGDSGLSLLAQNLSIVLLNEGGTEFKEALTAEFSEEFEPNRPHSSLYNIVLRLLKELVNEA